MAPLERHGVGPGGDGGGGGGDGAGGAAAAPTEPDPVDGRAADGFTALHLAAFFGRPSVARLLLDRGADPNAWASGGLRVQPLHSAVAGGHEAVAAMLIEAGADVNAAQDGGYTPLMGAAQNGLAATVALLLAEGAEPNALNEDVLTAADLADRAGHAEVADLDPRRRRLSSEPSGRATRSRAVAARPITSGTTRLPGSDARCMSAGCGALLPSLGLASAQPRNSRRITLARSPRACGGSGPPDPHVGRVTFSR